MLRKRRQNQWPRSTRNWRCRLLLFTTLLICVNFSTQTTGQIDKDNDRTALASRLVKPFELSVPKPTGVEECPLLLDRDLRSSFSLQSQLRSLISSDLASVWSCLCWVEFFLIPPRFTHRTPRTWARARVVSAGWSRASSPLSRPTRHTDDLALVWHRWNYLANKRTP